MEIYAYTREFLWKLAEISAEYKQTTMLYFLKNCLFFFWMFSSCLSQCFCGRAWRKICSQSFYSGRQNKHRVNARPAPNQSKSHLIEWKLFRIHCSVIHKWRLTDSSSTNCFVCKSGPMWFLSSINIAAREIVSVRGCQKLTRKRRCGFELEWPAGTSIRYCWVSKGLGL